MPHKGYDVIVLGLGAYGASVIYQCAKRGLRTLGIDQFPSPHDKGSSHGETRLTRLAIGEGEHLTPFAVRSHALWREIGQETDERLLKVTGGLIISSAGATSVNHVPGLYRNTLAAAVKHGIRHEILTSAAIRRIFPPFMVQDGEMGYYEPEAGFLRPERCIEAQLRLAERRGAELRTDTSVIGIGPDGGGAVVYTKQGIFRAARLVVCAGPWTPRLVGPRYAKLFSVRRQVLHWFDAKKVDPFLIGNFPIFFWELQGARQGIYGFPAIDGVRGGVKIATEQVTAATTPETIDRTVAADEGKLMYEGHVKDQIDGLWPRTVRSEVCMYTVTPDSGFIVDAHPDAPAVTIVSACSGHGFKHSPAIGEAVAERIATGKSRLDLAPFSFARFKDLL